MLCDVALLCTFTYKVNYSEENQDLYQISNFDLVCL